MEIEEYRSIELFQSIVQSIERFSTRETKGKKGRAKSVLPTRSNGANIHKP